MGAFVYFWELNDLYWKELKFSSTWDAFCRFKLNWPSDSKVDWFCISSMYSSISSLSPLWKWGPFHFNKLYFPSPKDALFHFFFWNWPCEKCSKLKDGETYGRTSSDQNSPWAFSSGKQTIDRHVFIKLITSWQLDTLPNWLYQKNH